MAAIAGSHYLLGLMGVITLPYEAPIQVVSGNSVVDHMGISRFSREPRFAGWGGDKGKGKGGGAGGANELTPLLPTAAAAAPAAKIEGVRKMPADTDDRACPPRAEKSCSRSAPIPMRCVDACWRVLTLRRLVLDRQRALLA